jgi:hypothetical protein
LRKFLDKGYENLLTAELFCHGVPSPAVWQKFLAENTQKEKIAAIDFRYKRFGWNFSFLNITYKDGSCLPSAPLLLRPLLNIKNGCLFRYFYSLSFTISSLYERPSCHACHFKEKHRADVSMGDLWGVQKTYPAQYDKQGVSVLLINTPKARLLFNQLSLETVPIDIQKVTRYNPYLVTSVKPHPKRSEFFARYQTENFNKLVRELLGIRSVWIAVPVILVKKIVQKLLS